MEETGFFNSSNELLNKFVEVTKWSAKGDSTDLPTDCPTRERHGWTGDAQIFCKTASYLLTMRHLPKNSCAICATNSSKTAISAR